MIFVALSLLTLVLFGITKRIPNTIVPPILLLICYAWVFSLRSMGVADTEPYYETYIGGLDPNMELGYLAINYYLHDEGVPFNFFLLFIAIFDLLLWYFCTRKVLHQNNVLIALLVFMSYIGLLYYGIVIRSGMASAIMYIPLTYLLLSYEKRTSLCKCLFLVLLFFLFMLFAGLFHQTIYVLIIALFLYFVPLNNKVRYAILVIGFIVSATPALSSFLTAQIQPLLQENDFRMADRFNRDIQSGVSINQIVLVVYGFIFIKLLPTIQKKSDKRQYELILDLFCVGAFISGLFSFLTAGIRLGHLLLFYDFLLPAILLKSSGSCVTPKKVYRIILVIVALNFIRLFSSVPTLLHYID